MSKALKILEGEGWVDIAPPKPEELQEEPSLLGFIITPDGEEIAVRGGICTSQEPSEQDKVEGLVSYSEYSTGEYSVSHREVERTVEIDGEEETKPLPQVKVVRDK